MADIHSEWMGLLARVPYVRCEDVHRQYAVNWLMNNGVTIPVRCKDCKHHEIFDDLLYCNHTRGLAGSVQPDGYCYLGERKDNGSE